MDPLTWEEARCRLRTLLDQHIKEPPRPPLSRDENEEKSAIIRHDVDLYVGAFAAVVLLIFSGMSLSGYIGASAEKAVYHSQVVSSAFLLAGSGISLWMTKRRNFLKVNDTDTAQRRDILRFMRALDQYKQHENASEDQDSNMSLVTSELNGTTMSDIYPTYRRNKSGRASWVNLPSLLLVRGDCIALQIGDAAPAKCEIVVQDPAIGQVALESGETLSQAAFTKERSDVLETLPKGKSTLSPGSPHLLTLCNHKCAFTLSQSPLETFINRPAVMSTSSQTARRLKALRVLQFWAGIALVVLCCVILMTRHLLQRSDLSVILPIPLLVAVAMLPITGPFFFFLLEALGTARILVEVHPHASSTMSAPKEMFPRTKLLLRYLTVTIVSRFSLWEVAQQLRACFGFQPTRETDRFTNRSNLVRVPPASLNLLEKLGVATAFALVDDELVCQPDAIPQQLLIPTGQGLKLLDLCPAYDEDSDGVTMMSGSSQRHHGGKSLDSDSESEEGTSQSRGALHRKILRPKKIFKSKRKMSDESFSTVNTTLDVQFEEPNWWQYLPSLKCIGLACLVIDDDASADCAENPMGATAMETEAFERSETSLTQSVCRKQDSDQLRSLASCIGFSKEPNSFGRRGDLSTFSEVARVNIVKSELVRERLISDAHERSSAESRWWGFLRPDATSVVTRDARTKALQLLTVGDPFVVIDLCQEAWQGEISTILPLGEMERQTIFQTAKNWKLADLDVSTFAYCPVPRSLEAAVQSASMRKTYLLDNCAQMTTARDKSVSPEWSLLRNQIFLGLLGSVVVPRQEIQGLLSELSDAGVRFVYFSPRNMRRQKELASQMGIDVAWNCAISLRPLESGAQDPHRMTSNYADWNVNAKLPHGVEDVKRHLHDVDNVPLLVSLFTDVTKDTTREMVEVFQAHFDTVIAIGVSHLSRNDGIFSTADIAVGIDVLPIPATISEHSVMPISTSHVLPAEIEFVSSIAARSCAFRFRSIDSIRHLTDVIDEGRAALDAAGASSMFVVYGLVSYALFVFFGVCTPSTTIPFMPVLGSVLYLQVLLPVLGFTMAMSRGDRDLMNLVPAKNDPSIIFTRRDWWRSFASFGLKALAPSLLPQLLHPVVFGEVALYMDADFVAELCPGTTSWFKVFRCQGLNDFTGQSRIASGILVLGEMVLCVVTASAGFLSQRDLLVVRPPWRQNRAWLVSSTLSVLATILYCLSSVSMDPAALPWYLYIVAAFTPFCCLAWVEYLKHTEIKLERRAEKLRRLQFETRLGAWSPK